MTKTIRTFFFLRSLYYFGWTYFDPFFGSGTVLAHSCRLAVRLYSSPQYLGPRSISTLNFVPLPPSSSSSSPARSSLGPSAIYLSVSRYLSSTSVALCHRTNWTSSLHQMLPTYAHARCKLVVRPHAHPHPVVRRLVPMSFPHPPPRRLAGARPRPRTYISDNRTRSLTHCHFIPFLFNIYNLYIPLSFTRTYHAPPPSHIALHVTFVLVLHRTPRSRMHE